MTFLADFVLLGRTAVDLDPSDMLSSSVLLTLFSFLWYDLRIIIGILCEASEAMKEDFRRMLKMISFLDCFWGSRKC